MSTSRFAPSPSGLLHLGHAYSAALGRHNGTRCQLRIEDLDPGRCRPDFIGGICADLTWLGLEPDGEPLVQSTRTTLYQQALDRLKEMGLVYACFCTRTDIAASLTAPHGDAGAAYPGICRDLPDDPARRARVPHSWRLNSVKALAITGLLGWQEHDGRHFAAHSKDIGDAILARKDAPSSYHLACVVDDAQSGVDLVVRGADLRPSTPLQRTLQRLLDLPEPCYLHHPLVCHRDGRRLSKRDQAPTLAAMRANGCDGRQLVKSLLAGTLPLGYALIDY